jgi:acyl-CoA thioester hydrolase
MVGEAVLVAGASLLGRYGRWRDRLLRQLPRFLERARTEWLRTFGISQRELAREAGVVFAVVSLSIQYRRPAKLDDELIITCEARLEGAASVRFVQQIHLAGAPETPLVGADVLVACVDAQSLRPKRLPAFLTNALAEEVA